MRRKAEWKVSFASPNRTTERAKEIFQKLIIDVCLSFHCSNQQYIKGRLCLMGVSGEFSWWTTEEYNTRWIQPCMMEKYKRRMWKSKKENRKIRFSLCFLFCLYSVFSHFFSFVVVVVCLSH